MSPLSLDHIVPCLGDGEVPGVIISGSMPLQVVVGQTWAGCDIDLFCIESHANQLRHVLINQYNMVCCSFWHTYDQRDKTLRHVESYAPRPSDYTTADMDAAIARGYKFVIFGDFRGFSRKYTDIDCSLQQWCQIFAFPYDPKLPKGFIQLIIGGKKVTSPYELTKTFDINVCRVAYDGRAFSLPWETDIFNSKARLMKQYAEIEQYLKSLDCVDQIPCYIRFEDGWDDFWLVNSIHRMWKYMTRGFVIKGLPTNFSHLANHPVRRNWLVYDPARMRLNSARLYLSRDADFHACDKLCGATSDDAHAVRLHRRTCHLDAHDWPYA